MIPDHTVRIDSITLVPIDLDLRRQAERDGEPWPASTEVDVQLRSEGIELSAVGYIAARTRLAIADTDGLRVGQRYTLTFARLPEPLAVPEPRSPRPLDASAP